MAAQPSDEPGSAETPGAAVYRGHWKAHQDGLAARLRAAVPGDVLRDLHRRDAWRHFAVAGRQVALLVLLGIVTVTRTEPWLWVPAAALQGFVVLSFIILLHDAIHDCVFRHRRPAATRALMLLYGLPSLIASSQFRRWHLDHHDELGSATDDPKRAHLSPKRNARWFKALYMTPALFAIYARAAGTEARTYAAPLRRAILLERLGNAAVHAALVAWIWNGWGGDAVLRAWVAPLFAAFPVAFTVNRLGQHYWIDPTDPAKWGTRVDGNPLIGFLFLQSHLHLEHHYFPSVPLYRLPALNRRLRPFWDGIGHPSRGYGRLLWKWFVENRAPHTNWDLPARSGAGFSDRNESAALSD